jgi:hypothetical protein
MQMQSQITVFNRLPHQFFAMIILFQLAWEHTLELLMIRAYSQSDWNFLFIYFILLSLLELVEHCAASELVPENIEAGRKATRD